MAGTPSWARLSANTGTNETDLGTMRAPPPRSGYYKAPVGSRD
ncbi:hypothetical protein ACFPRL_34945 [Pseudoclavibacter helvolus]